MRRTIIFIGVLIAVLSFSIVVQAQDAASATVHTVVAGENLYRISLRYGVSMTAIAQQNNLSNLNIIYVGQRLVIPTGGTTPPPTSTPPPNTTPTPPPASGTCRRSAGDIARDGRHRSGAR